MGADSAPFSRRAARVFFDESALAEGAEVVDVG